MALRSTVSSLSSSATANGTAGRSVPRRTARTAPLEPAATDTAPDETSSTSDAVEETTSTPPLARTPRAAAPASEAAPVAPAVARRGRGRPRKDPSAPKTERKPRAAKPADPTSPSALRAALREVEAEFKTLKEQMEAAVAKFEPRVGALRAKHAELSAQLAASLLH